MLSNKKVGLLLILYILSSASGNSSTVEINIIYNNYKLHEVAASVYYLENEMCEEIDSIACCCSDGIQRICTTYVGMTFTCRPGGIFDCTSDLGDCLPSADLQCESCCPSCA